MPGIGLHLFDPAFVARTPSGLINSPEDIDTPIYWLDAEDGPKDNADAAITVDGTAVKTWTNKGSRATNPTNGTAGERPTWKDNYLNGKAVVKFDGTNDALIAVADGHISLPVTGFIVARWVGPRILDGGSQFQDSFVGGSAAHGWGWAADDRISATNERGFIFGQFGQDPTSFPAEMDHWAHEEWVIIGSVWNEPGTSKIAINSLTWSSFTVTSGAHVFEGLCLGDSENRNCRGRPEIAELILYDHEITDDEKEAVMLYYADKYNITLDGDWPTGIIGDDDFESYADEDNVDGKTGGTRFNGAWESH